MLRLLLQPPRNLWANTGHYPHCPSREPVQPTTARVPWYRDNFPGRTHGTPQAAAMSCWALSPQGHPASVPLPVPWPEWARAPELAAPLTPTCLSEEQTPSSALHAEAGPNPKLNPGSCVNKEEKGKFLPAASGAEDEISTINLMYPASVGYLNRQWINPNWGDGLWEQRYIIFPPFSLFVSV